MQQLRHIFYRMFGSTPPSVIAAFALIEGMICLKMHSTWLVPLFCIGGGELLHRMHGWSRTTAWLMLACISCCGALRLLSQRTQQLEMTQVIPYGMCTVRGAVVGASLTKNAYYPYQVDLLTDYVVSVHNDKKRLTTPIVIRIMTHDKTLFYEPGTIVELSHVLIFKEWETHHEHHLAKNNLSCSGKTTKQSIANFVQARAKTTATNNIQQVRQRIIDAARKSFSPMTFPLVAAMFFGHTLAHDQHNHALRETFSWWGLNHLLARSGLHLAMFMLLFGLIFGLIPLPFLWKHVLILIIIGFYILLSWSSISFIRAACMMGWYVACMSTYTAPHPLHIISCISIGALLYQPYYLFGLDFQLSFGLTFALAVISHSAKIHKAVSPKQSL